MTGLLLCHLKITLVASGQDGGVGRHTVPLCTTKRRTITNLKQKITRTARKSKLYGSLTNKEIKKKHSSRWVGGAEMGSWAERTRGKAAAGRPGRLWSGLGKAAASRPYRVVAGGPCGPTFAHR